MFGVLHGVLTMVSLVPLDSPACIASESATGFIRSTCNLLSPATVCQN